MLRAKENYCLSKEGLFGSRERPEQNGHLGLGSRFCQRTEELNVAAVYMGDDALLRRLMCRYAVHESIHAYVANSTQMLYYYAMPYLL